MFFRRYFFQNFSAEINNPNDGNFLAQAVNAVDDAPAPPSEANNGCADRLVNHVAGASTLSTMEISTSPTPFNRNCLGP